MARRQGFYEKYIKRAFDVIFSLAAMAVLSPVFLFIAVLVRAKLGRPVLFCQERPGLNDKIFKIYKFRTMTDERNADGILLPDSERLTRTGRTLRSWSLDELPELFNILKGDMSFIGPRPLLTRYLDRYSDFQHRRHEVRPGLSGWAQVHGRNCLSWEDKFRYDVEYVDNLSFGMDVKIFFMTIAALIRREGISSDTSDTMEEFKGGSDGGNL